VAGLRGAQNHKHSENGSFIPDSDRETTTTGGNGRLVGLRAVLHLTVSGDSLNRRHQTPKAVHGVAIYQLHVHV